MKSPKCYGTWTTYNKVYKEWTGYGSSCPSYEYIDVLGFMMMLIFCEIRDQGSDAGDDTPVVYVDKVI